MSGDHDELALLDEMLARHYMALREAVPGQRDSILKRLPEAQATDRLRGRRAWRGPLVWLATAAGLAVVAASVSLLVPSSARHVYGIEAVSKQLAEVQTFRQRGYWIIYPRHDANGPPVRVPIDNLVKRPDKFRHSWYGVSYPHDGPMIVKRGSVACNGRRASRISEEDKHLATSSTGVLDAWITTETWAQEFLTNLLGPPGVPYKKIGRETISGRVCDVYEGRLGDRNEYLSKLWLDPTTGYPVRSTQDELMPDGTTRRVKELEKIEVNVPLDDKLFELAAPDGFKVVADESVVDPTTLSSWYTSAGFGGDKKLEVWHAFRITDAAALVVWRRSKPEEKEDGTSDWLSGMTFSIFGDDRKRDVRHNWVYQSRSPDVWSWSLVATADGPLADRGGVRINLKSKPLHATMDMIPLRFPEQGLERIIEAAVRATLPEDAPRFKLEHLVTLAEPLTRGAANR
jgi:hypothetical protein